MDGTQFDVIAKAMHKAPSRRRFLEALAGIAGAAIAGQTTMQEGLAQTFVATRYDLTCRNAGVRSFCFNPEPVTTCGPSEFGCRCGILRQGKARVCIEQPSDGCPTKRTRCSRNKDCRQDEVCIRVRNCCRAHPAWGKCVRRCNV